MKKLLNQAAFLLSTLRHPEPDSGSSILSIVKQFIVYILASKKNGTLYVGMTCNLEQRMHQHKNKLIEGFTKNYRVDQLVYFEECLSGEQATNRERQLNEWRRAWKVELIENKNPYWRDLSETIFNWIPNQVRDDEIGKQI